MSSEDWQRLVARFASCSARAGLDLVHPFSVARYNSVVPAEERLHDFGRADALGILVGNTRALWPVFRVALADDAALRAAEHPLDRYVETALNGLACELAPHAHQSYLAHVVSPRALPMQRLAELVGFAALSPSKLVIHPVHGLWCALRAVVVVDVPGPCQQAAEPVRPCRDCSAPCLPALQHALEVSGSPLEASAITKHADAWIAVRDACPVGRASRYGEDQLGYHYGTSRRRHGS